MNRRYSLLSAAVVGVAVCTVSLSGLGRVTLSQAREIPSQAASLELERKLEAIEAASSDSTRAPRTIRVTEHELESYVLYGLADELAVRIDAVDLEIQAGQLLGTVDMFVAQELVESQPLAGPLFQGDHAVYFEGAFEAHRGRGRFELERVRVDGIPVPVFLVRTLLKSLDDPIDLDQPLETPIGIDDVVLVDRAVNVTY